MSEIQHPRSTYRSETDMVPLNRNNRKVPQMSQVPENWGLTENKSKGHWGVETELGEGRSGEVTRWLRVLTTLVKDPSTHMVTHRLPWDVTPSFVPII